MYKKILVSTLIIGAFVACGRKAEDKQAKLEKLKKERGDIQQQINELETELQIKSDATAVNAPIVRITEAKPQTFKHYLEIQGRVDSDENLMLTAKVPGAQVTSVRVVRGDKVRKGQVLATQDANTVEQNISALKTQFELASTVYRKQKALWDQKIGTEIQYLTAKANKEALEKQLGVLYETLALYTIKSPIDGTVDDVTIKMGEVPTPGISGIRVVNYAKTKVVADVSESYLGKINAGDEVVLQFPDVNREMKSRVRVTGRVINTSSRSFMIEIPVVQAEENELHPNMVAIVKINDYTNSSAILIDVNAIQKDETGSFVYVAKNENGKWIARRQVIMPGQTYGGMTEIKSGLSDGVKVITTGYQNVTDGQEVKI